MNYPISQLSSVGGNITGCAQTLKGIASELESVNSAIISCFGQGGVGGRAQGVAGTVRTQALLLDTLGSAATSAATLYRTAETNICTTVYAVSGENYVPQMPPGVAAVVAESDGFFDYVRKGWKTAVAVGSAVVATAGCAATWAATIASGGAGAPVAILSTAYTANAIHSSCSDIKNIWLGDESQVGKVNWLKDKVVDGVGDLSEMLGGNREVGELVGKCVYGAGDLIVNIENAKNFAGIMKGETSLKSFENEFTDKVLSKSPLTLRDRIIQNDTSFETVKKAVEEIPTAVSGLWDIAKNSPLREIPKDYALLKPGLENIEKVVGVTKLLKEVGKVTTDVTSAVIDAVMSAAKHPGPILTPSPQFSPSNLAIGGIADLIADGIF